MLLPLLFNLNPPNFAGYDGFYNAAKVALADGTIDWDDAGATVKMLLIDNDGSYVFVPMHSIINDLDPTNNECSGTGYARKTISSRTVTQDDANDLAKCDAADASVYTGADFGTVQAAVIYWEVTDDSDSIPICYLGGGSCPFPTGGGDLTLEFFPDGVWSFE